MRRPLSPNPKTHARRLELLRRMQGKSDRAPLTDAEAKVMLAVGRARMRRRVRGAGNED